MVLQRLRVRRWIYSCSKKVTKTVVVAEYTCIVYLYASDARHQPLLGPHWAVLSCDTLKYSPHALNSGGPFQIFALNRTSAYLCRFLNGINEIPFSTFLNLGAIVCNDTHQAHDSRPHHLRDRSTSTVTMLSDVYDVTTSSPLRGFYFWHFKCWICCIVFKNPNQNVRTRGQSRTTAQSLQQGCQVHNGLRNHRDDLAPSLHLTKRKDIKIKPTGPPHGQCSCHDAII